MLVLQQVNVVDPQPWSHMLKEHSDSQCVHVQEYNVAKRVEHSVKALRHDGSTISAVDPRTYSRRFQDFIGKVFV